MRTRKALLISPNWELLHITVGEISTLCEEAPYKPAVPMTATVMGAHEGAHVELPVSLFKLWAGSDVSELADLSLCYPSRRCTLSEMSASRNQTPNLTWKLTCITEQMFVELILAEIFLSFSGIASGHSRVQSEWSAISRALVDRFGVKFERTSIAQYVICQSVLNLMSSEWRSNNHLLSQWLPQLIQLIDLYLGILKTADNALWRRPAALYRLSVAGYIQHTIDPEPSNTSKQRKSNLRSVYRAFSESSRMPSASSLLRASSSAQVCML